jgi:DNA-directed RNA polymerase subunit F
MKCKYLGKIEKFYENKLGDHEITIINKHLETCNICGDFLKELEYNDQFFTQIKLVQPDLADPVNFRNEVLSKIKLKPKMVFRNDIRNMVEAVIYILVQPATRFTFISAAVLFFGLFVYQQSTIVQKIGTLEKRMETNIKTRNSQSFMRDKLEVMSKYQEIKPEQTEDIRSLINDYRLLQIQYRFLVEILKDAYPETYNELKGIIVDENSSLSNNYKKKIL